MSSTVTPNKCHSITRLLATRIDQGMYLNGPIPGERALATELGVSYLTVRRATKQLVDDGVLSRMSNGRLQPSHKTSKTRRGPQIGLLVDTFPVNAMREWFTDLDQLVGEHDGTLHLISYNDKDDPRVFEALDQELDGLFIIYRYELSPLLRDRLVRHAHRLVSLWFDMTSLGIPSIENAPARYVSRAVEYLKELGHQRVVEFDHDRALVHEVPRLVRRLRLADRLHVDHLRQIGHVPVQEVEAAQLRVAGDVGRGRARRGHSSEHRTGRRGARGPASSDAGPPCPSSKRRGRGARRNGATRNVELWNF